MALAAKAEGKVWLFTLGSKGAMLPDGTKVVEIGPFPRITAPEYLLCINSGIARLGAKSSVHTHPGPDAFYVLSGQLTQKTPKGVYSGLDYQVSPNWGTVLGYSPQGLADANHQSIDLLRELAQYVNPVWLSG